QNSACDGETHENSEHRLSKTDVQPQERGQHSVEQHVAKSGEQKDEGQFDRRVSSLERRSPAADRSSEQASTTKDHSGVKERPPWSAALHGGIDPFGFSTKE